MYSSLTVIFYPKNTKFSVKLSAYKGRLHFKFEVNRASCFCDTRDQNFGVFSSPSSSFCTNHKIGFNSQVRTLIRLKFSILVGHQVAIISTNSGQNPYKFLKVIIDHLRKTRTIFRHEAADWINLKIGMQLGSTSDHMQPFGG